MKISNFRDYKLIPREDYDFTRQKKFSCHRPFSREYATVNVETTRFWFFKHKEPREVVRDAGMYWKFVDTGHYTPGCVVEQLYDEYMEKLNG